MKIVRIWFAVFFFACAAISAFLYVREEIPYIEGRLAGEKLSGTYLKAEETEAARKVDFKGLQTVNPDIIGWIYIPGTQVDDPILQHPAEDDYYLSHSPEKKRNKLGAVYMHHDTDAGFGDAHTILFGHNMKSGQMFGELSKFEDKDFAEKYPDVWIFLPEEDLHCAVYSTYSCSIDDLTYTVGYETDQKNYKEFIYHTLDRSCIPAEEIPTEMDQIVTLSTCTDSGDAEKRFVVNCRIIERSKK